MAVWVLVPPLPRMSGGLRVLVQLACQLRDLGVLAAALAWEAPPAELGGDLPWQRAQEAALRPADVLLVPEGWPNALALAVRAGCRAVVYCQNWAYLFHGLPEGVRWAGLPVDFLAVSHPVAWYLEQVLGKRPPVVRPALDRAVWYAPAAPAPGPLRVAWMPRKNKALAETTRRILAERAPRLEIAWQAIHGLPPQGVAEALRSCHVFLATGFPEGCSLPPLEAMACGCLPVGCTGLGAWDYARQVDPDGYAPHGYVPRPVPWGGNGLWTPDGDPLALALAVEQAAALRAETGAWQQALEAGQAAAAAYGAAQQRQEVEEWLASL